MFKKVIKEEYKIPAEISYLGEMRDFVTRVGRKYGVAERIINAFKLAIDEAATNIIRHAYRDWDGFITIRIIIRDKSVTVSMIDQGHTFDPRNVRDPDLHRYVDIGKKGGLGIFIIRRVIDTIDYRKTVEGNELRLTKKREISPRKRFLLPGISLTMKTRFSLIASGILTFLVLVGFIWNYFQQEGKILKEQLEIGQTLARSMAHNSLDYLVKEETWELARIAAQVQRDHAPLVTEALAIDTTGIIQGAVRTDLILEPFVIPKDAIRKAPGVYEYTMPDGKVVYDIVEAAIQKVSGVPRRMGTIRILLDKSVIDGEIASARKKALWLLGLVLLIGYSGVFILVYVTMSPFKKLSAWIRALGRDEAHEEMEFDSSDEIGEIANAFNEITEKFRKSQENLAEQERLQKEMQVAQEIQHTLLPSAFPEIEGYEIASYYEAAKEVGGDYFDFVEVDKDTLGIVVADVSGKGVPGSLIMTMIRTALRTEARGNKNAADVLARVNDFVINDMKKGMFVTIFYIILDSHNRTINYASAGHNPMILYRSETKKSYYLNPRGFPIGINLPDNTLFKKSIQSDTLRLREGDTLIIYTDGITEAMNLRREKFGEERFLSVIREYGHLRVNPFVDKISDEIKNFTEGYAQNDDITLVAIREKMRAEDVLFNLRSRMLEMVNKEGMSIKEACRAVGVSPSTYYKYKKRFEKMGIEGLKEKMMRSEIEEKHISIEDKAKIYDIIKEHPEYGAKRISEELRTEKYGFTEIDERRIYEELVRSHLNTKDLRIAFVEKGEKGKRMKPPGTPFLTLDGQIILSTEIHKVKEIQTSSGDFAKEEKLPLEIRASQRPREEIYAEAETEQEEEATVLDEFLGFSEEMEDQGKGEEETPVLLESDKGIEEFLEVEEKGEKEESPVLSKSDSVGEKEFPETEVKDEAEKEESEQIPVTEEIDEVFDELITDVGDFVDEGETISDSEEHLDLEQILETREDDSSEEIVEDMIEDRISNSIADELLDEEIGISEASTEKGEGETPEEEGFVDMMEDLGFDRRTVLSEGRKKAKNPRDVANSLKKRQLFESGLWFYRQGLYEKAIEEFKKAMEIDPNSVDIYQCLGDAFFRLGELDKARESYEKVRQLDPNNINVLENLGVIFANRGDYKRAVWQWGEVLKHNPERRDIIDRIKKMQRVIRQKYS